MVLLGQVTLKVVLVGVAQVTKVLILLLCEGISLHGNVIELQPVVSHSRVSCCSSQNSLLCNVFLQHLRYICRFSQGWEQLVE
jgi:hypothetical protein